jgi:hypothetical protein
MRSRWRIQAGLLKPASPLCYVRGAGSEAWPASVPGNILAGDVVIESAIRARIQMKVRLADRITQAMKAAHAAVSGVTNAAACPTRAAVDSPAHVAHLVIIKKDDKIGGGLSDDL